MDVVELLRDQLPADALVTDPDVLVAYSRDQAALAPSGRPLLAVLPRTTAEVATVVRAARATGTPVVSRGAGTGLAGAANAADGCLVLSLQRMDRVVEVRPDDLLARVEPGVVTADLKRAVAEHGLWYAPDPASVETCTIGGNVATNAGGLCCVKYGVTRDAVLGLEVVLADGEVVRLGGSTVKDVAGYDLVGLLVGSEGTLGVVTEVTVRLRTAPAAATTLVATFDSLRAAGRAISGTVRRTTPALLEVLDRTTLGAVEDHLRMGLERDLAALLVARSDLPGEAGRAETAMVQRACEDAGATYVAVSADPQEAEMLLAARRAAYPALERLGTTLLDDVGVPLGRVVDLLDGVERIAEQEGVTIGTFGHAGDGNLHPTVVFDAADPAAAAAARRAFDRVVDLAVDLGGTLAGEHGVGTLKQAHLTRTMQPGVARMHAAVKRALDPDGVLNPGRALP